MSRIYPTLDPHRCGSLLSLLQGNLVVTTTKACDFHRAVFGSLANGIGLVGFEAYVYSNSQPPAGLPNFFSVGVAEVSCGLDKYVGEQPLSWGLRTSDGAANAGIYNNAAQLTALQAIPERHCIGVLLRNDPVTPQASWHDNGNLLAQANLTPGKFYVPALSIGSDTGGNVSAVVNFGQRGGLDYPVMFLSVGGALTQFAPDGWYEVTSTGVGVIYLAITDEGMTTAPGDTPANVQYRPRVLNPDQFSIEINPGHWVQGTTANQGASFGQLEIDNYDGAFNFLLSADVRDAVVVIKMPQAGALLTGTVIRDAPTVATAIVDSVSCDNEDHIKLNLKDVIARLDKQLPVRYEPPFVDAGAANNPMPLSFGAFRNRVPLLVDTPNRLFRLHDANVPNVALVADKAAPLDPHANPPQYLRALDGGGFQLQVMPVGKLTADGASYGTQAAILGAADILNGDGLFLGAWTGTPAVPPGFSFSNLTGSVISKVANPFGLALNAASLLTKKLCNFSNTFGDWLKRPACLKGGYTYQLNLCVTNIVATITGNLPQNGGLVIATALSANAVDYIAGFKAPIQAVYGGKNGTIQITQNLSFQFTVPAGAARDLYFIISAATQDGTTPFGNASMLVYNITIAELGVYQQLPLNAMPLANYFTELLVARAGEDPSVFNASDLDSIGLRADGSRMPWGITFDQPPNILDALKIVTSTFGCFTPFADNLGSIRTRRFVDPSDPALPVVADFNMSNIERPIAIEDDKAPNLTTLYGARPNCSKYGISDFVTDQTLVPQDIKTRFMRDAQFEITSSVSPAGFYAHAIGAPMYVTRFDEAADCQAEGDRIVGIFSQKVYSDSSIATGKRFRVTFTARFDNIAALGATVQVNAAQLLPGDIVRLTYSNADGTPLYVNQRCEVLRRKLYPFAQKIEITVEV